MFQVLSGPISFPFCFLISLVSPIPSSVRKKQIQAHHYHGSRAPVLCRSHQRFLEHQDQATLFWFTGTMVRETSDFPRRGCFPTCIPELPAIALPPIPSYLLLGETHRPQNSHVQSWTTSPPRSPSILLVPDLSPPHSSCPWHSFWFPLLLLTPMFHKPWTIEDFTVRIECLSPSISLLSCLQPEPPSCFSAYSQSFPVALVHTVRASQLLQCIQSELHSCFGVYS